MNQTLSIEDVRPGLVFQWTTASGSTRELEVKEIRRKERRDAPGDAFVDAGPKGRNKTVTLTTTVDNLLHELYQQQQA